MPAARLGRLIASLEGRGSDERQALALLASWDHRLEAASAPAALFEVWWMRHLRPSLLARLVPDPTTRSLMGVGDVAGVLDLLENPDHRLSADARDELLLDSLGEAYAACRSLMGETVPAWAWGRLHKAFFEHPATAASTQTQTSFDVGPFDIGGSNSTPMNTYYRPNDFRLAIGASFRIVVDVGAWDNSVCVNTPGQSGDPRSPHYADLAPVWAAGDYVPLLYTWPAIEKAAETRIRLMPERAN